MKNKGLALGLPNLVRVVVPDSFLLKLPSTTKTSRKG